MWKLSQNLLSFVLRNPRRRDDGFHGSQYRHRSVVFETTWPRSRSIEYGSWFCESLHARRRGDADPMVRLASNLGGFRVRYAGSRGCAVALIYQALPRGNGALPGWSSGTDRLE